MNMAEASAPVFPDLRFDSKPWVIPPNTYEDILEASKILATLKPENVQLHPNMSKVPLFSGTSLKSECGETSISTLRKNVYFIARQCMNFEDLLKNFVNCGILTVDDRDKIKNEEGSLQRTVLMFSIMVTKNEDNFPILINVLNDTGNEIVADFLQKKLSVGIKDAAYMHAKEDDTPEASAATSSPDIDSVSEEGEDNSTSSKWACKYCTFLNSDLVEDCLICNNPFSIRCQICTLINTNTPYLTLCMACDAPLPFVCVSDSE